MPDTDVAVKDDMDNLVDIATIRLFLQSIFECGKCGTCCRVYNNIPVDGKYDLDNIAKQLSIGVDELKARYLTNERSTDSCDHAYESFIHNICEISDTAYDFKDKPCAFLNGDKCKIYQARPFTCRGYPFMIQSKDADYDNKVWVIMPSDTCPSSKTCIRIAAPQFQKIEEIEVPLYKIPPPDKLLIIRQTAVSLRHRFLYGPYKGITEKGISKDIAKHATVAYLCLRAKGWRIKF